MPLGHAPYFLNVEARWHHNLQNLAGPSPVFETFMAGVVKAWQFSQSEINNPEAIGTSHIRAKARATRGDDGIGTRNGLEQSAGSGRGGRAGEVDAVAKGV